MADRKNKQPFSPPPISTFLTNSLRRGENGPSWDLAQAYAKIGIPFDDAAARAAIDSALESNKRGKYGQLVYDLRSDFGLEPAAIRERFEFYLDRFPNVQVEVE